MKTLSLASALASMAIAFSVGCGSTDASGTSGTSPSTGASAIVLERQLDSTKSYRLVGLWVQLDDDGPDPAVEIAFDVAFDPSAASVAVPAPVLPTDPVLYCMRASDDESVSPCLESTPVRLGIGVVFIAEDENENGKFDVDPSKPKNGEPIALTAHGAMLYSERGGDALPERKSGPLVEGTVSAGTHFYEAFRAEPGATFDRLRLPASGTPIRFGAKGPNLS